MYKKKEIRNHYSYLDALWMSFYSPKVYLDAAKRWSGFGLAYLLLVCFLAAAPIAFKFIHNTESYFKETLGPAIKEMPTLIIHDKQLVFKEDKKKGITTDTTVWIWPPKPSFEHPFPDIVINLTRQLGSFDAVFVPVLITEDFLRIQNFSPWGESVATDTFSVSKESDSVLGPVEVKKIFTQIERNLVNTAYPYLGWLMWASLLPCLLVLSTVVNLLYFALFRFKLPWQESIRILCIALTPGIVFLESLYFFQYFNQKWVLFGFAVIVGYYLLGVRARHIDIGLVKR